MSRGVRDADGRNLRQFPGESRDGDLQEFVVPDLVRSPTVRKDVELPQDQRVRVDHVGGVLLERKNGPLRALMGLRDHFCPLMKVKPTGEEQWNGDGQCKQAPLLPAGVLQQPPGVPDHVQRDPYSAFRHPPKRRCVKRLCFRRRHPDHYGHLSGKCKPG